jgi:crotonobetaine/carnitine-CoA ligase
MPGETGGATVLPLRTYGGLSLTFPERDEWNLSHILALRAKEGPDKRLLWTAESGWRTYDEIDRSATRIASGFRRSGIHPGERVMILLDNCEEYVLSWFGATRAGLVEVPTNTDYFGSFLAHSFRTTTPAAAVVGSRFVERLVELANEPDVRKVHIFHVGDPDGGKALVAAGFEVSSFQELEEAEFHPGVPAMSLGSDLGAIIFTSGTTGPSKGVMMPHTQLYVFAEECVNLTRLGADDVYMSVGPLFHANAQFLAVYPALIVGAAVAVYDRFSASQFADRLRESGATVTNFIGVMMDWVAKQPVRPDDGDNKLRCIFSTPTAWTVIEDLRDRFGVEAFVDCFGQTEITLPVLTPYGADRPVGAAGLAVDDWFEIRLADPETDDEVPPGEMGELQLRPRVPWTVNSGYFANPEATAEARRNLWLHTGDGMRRDAEGWYYFVDRLKDCLRRRGENISSYEVEQPILANEAVAACAAVGVPAEGDAAEDEVAVYVTLQPDRDLLPEEIVAWASERMPAFIVPRFVAVVEDLPLTPSGKVRKGELRARGTTHMWDSRR